LGVWLPGERGWVKRRELRAWVSDAGWGRLTRVGESGRGRLVVFMGIWGLGAGSLAAFRLGGRLQSSIRSRGADQGVVRCPGLNQDRRPSFPVGGGGQTQERARPGLHLALW